MSRLIWIYNTYNLVFELTRSKYMYIYIFFLHYADAYLSSAFLALLGLIGVIVTTLYHLQRFRQITLSYLNYWQTVKTLIRLLFKSWVRSCWFAPNILCKIETATSFTTGVVRISNTMANIFKCNGEYSNLFFSNMSGVIRQWCKMA